MYYGGRSVSILVKLKLTITSFYAVILLKEFRSSVRLKQIIMSKLLSCQNEKKTKIVLFKKSDNHS